jgi:hypothetical protein
MLGDRSSTRTHALMLHDELSTLEEAANTVRMETSMLYIIPPWMTAAPQPPGTTLGVRSQPRN